MKKKVCFVNTHYFPVLGGITRYTYNLIETLKTKNVDSIIVTLNVCNMSEHEIVDDVEIYRLESINLMDGRFPILKWSARNRELLKQIFSNNIDLMVINARFYYLSLHMAVMARMKKIHAIVIDHGSSHLTMSSALLTKIGEMYEHVVTGMLKLFCKDFYGVSKASVNWLKHFHIEAKGVLYNAVDITEIDKMLENPAIDYIEKFELPKGADIVSFTGRLVVEKGILPLIEAVKEIRKKNSNVFLFIAGDGPLRQQIEREVDNGIFLLGQVELEEIICLLKQSTILCLPSKSEGFPTSVLEAVACKCFVSATKVGGAAEIIPGKEYGILLERNDAEHIEESILYAVNNSEKRQKAIELSYDRMVDNFTWEKTAGKIYELI